MNLTRISLLFIFVLFFPSTIIAEQTGGDQEPLPELMLKTPDSEIHRNYLGLADHESETFRLSDIKADILLIELFSMYCPFCQKEAPLVNELYEKMEIQSKNGVTIKIIGIGASNSQFEVDHFRDTYTVIFPLFADQDMAHYKALEGSGTPSFIGCLLSGESGPKIVLRNSGGFYSPEKFLAELLETSGL